MTDCKIGGIPWEETPDSDVYFIGVDWGREDPETVVFVRRGGAVRAGSEPGDVVLDPFCGTGTTGEVALRHGRRFVGIELSGEFAEMSRGHLAAEHGRIIADVKEET